MKKTHKIFIIIGIILLTIILIYLNNFRTINIEQTRALSKIYKLNNYENIELVFRNVLGTEIETIDTQTTKMLFDTLKKEKIKLISKLDYDKINISSAYRIKVKLPNDKFNLTISNDTINIDGKLYRTEKNLVKLLENVLVNYSEFYV